MNSADAVAATGRRQGDIVLSCASPCPWHTSREWSKPLFPQTEPACCAVPSLAACLSLPQPILKTLNAEGLWTLETL